MITFSQTSIGWPGSVHDVRFKKATSGELLQGEEVQIAYPLLTWLIKPFSFSFKFPTKEV